MPINIKWGQYTQFFFSFYFHLPSKWCKKYPSVMTAQKMFKPPFHIDNIRPRVTHIQHETHTHRTECKPQN